MNHAHFGPGMMHIGGFEILWGLLSAALWVGFWVLVVWLIVKAVRRGGRGPHRSDGLRILEERYARGEIGRDEFLERRAVLTGETPPQTPHS